MQKGIWKCHEPRVTTNQEVPTITSLPVWALIIAHFCNNVGNYTLLTNLPSYMREVLKFDIKSVCTCNIKF